MSRNETVVIDCTCCHLKQRLKDRDGAIPSMCDTCARHQGQLPEKRVTRAEEHEAMLRERLDACRHSEQVAQMRAENAMKRVNSALWERGSLASRLVKAAREAGRHNCDAVKLGREQKIVGLADDHERREEQW